MSENHLMERRVKLLPQLLANQIAAGEVVERPASIVKELIENAIDAHAKKIEIRIEEGGMQAIVVADDGGGIMQEDLVLAITPHATSKVYSLEELESITSLGFRGEALASIAAVSRFSIKSRFHDREAWQIEVEGKDHLPNIRPASIATGTKVEVRDVFFNIPARRKFLKSQATEFSHIEEVVRKLALSHLHIAFTLYHNHKLVFNLEHESPEKRLDRLCGKGFAAKSHLIQLNKAGFSLEGWLVQPRYLKRFADYQYFYINGRPVRDKLMLHALKEGYRDVLYGDHQPQYILFLELDPKLVDFNVHPAKLEVRFREGRLVHDFVLSEVKKALCTSTQEICHDKINDAPENTSASHSANSAIPKKTAAKTPAAVISTARPLFLSETEKLSFQAKIPVKNVPSHGTGALAQQAFETLFASTELPLSPLPKIVDFGQAICQLKGIFILAESKAGLIIVDMHAAHERILYERLKITWRQQCFERQVLLLPVTIELSRQEEIIFKEYQEKFAALGLLIEEWIDHKIILREVPLMLVKADFNKFMHTVLKELELLAHSNATETFMEHMLAEIACHSALQAQDSLTIAAMNQLLRDMEATPNIDYCNHGRPTWKLFSTAELSRFFIRGR